MMTRSKSYLDFGFCSEASHRQHCAHGPKINLKITGRVLLLPFNSYLKIEAAMHI